MRHSYNYYDNYFHQNEIDNNNESYLRINFYNPRLRKKPLNFITTKRFKANNYSRNTKFKLREYVTPSIFPSALKFQKNENFYKRKINKIKENHTNKFSLETPLIDIKKNYNNTKNKKSHLKNSNKKLNKTKENENNILIVNHSAETSNDLSSNSRIKKTSKKKAKKSIKKEKKSNKTSGYVIILLNCK